MTSPRVALGSAEAFIEASITGRPDSPTASHEITKLRAAGENSVADALAGVVAALGISAPAALEASAKALVALRHRQAELRVIGPETEVASSIGMLRVAPSGAAANPGVAALLARRVELSNLARSDPDALLRRARDLRSSADGRERADLANALALVPADRAAEAASALIASRPHDRSVSDALALLRGIDGLLNEIALDSSRELAERVAATASLVRRGSTADPSLPAPHESLAGGVAAWARFASTGDPSPLAAWLGWQREKDAESLGRIIAGWPHEGALVDFALERWQEGQARPQWEALLRGIDPPGLSYRLRRMNSARLTQLARELHSLDARLDAHLNGGDPTRSGAEPAPRVTQIDPATNVEALVFSGDAGSVEELIAMASANNARAARALSRIEIDAARRGEESLLISTYPDVADAAAWCLASRGPEGIRYARQLIRTGNAEFVAAGLRILAYGDIDEVRGDLIASMRGSDSWTIRAAIDSAARSGAATADRNLARAVLASLPSVAGGGMVVVPALASIGDAGSLEQARTLNENGHLFDSGQDDALFEALIESGREVVRAQAALREEERRELIGEWRSQGRLIEHSRGRIESLIRRTKKRGRG